MHGLWRFYTADGGYAVEDVISAASRNSHWGPSVRTYTPYAWHGMALFCFARWVIITNTRMGTERHLTAFRCGSNEK
jgi:hypothetical protein